MRYTPAVILLSSLSLAACGGDDGGSNVTPTIDAAGGIDAASNIDAAPAACTVSTTSFGDKGALTGSATLDVGTATADPKDDILEFDALLETTQPADAIAVILYAGYGAFTDAQGMPKAVTPGTYPLTGDETNFATCGVCVLLATNATSTGYDDDYMATGGTVTITQAGTAVGGTLTGTLTNVQFHHVDIDQSTGDTTQSADTCTTSLTNGTFTGTLAAPASGG
jgi:hypothetical protein